MKTFLLNLVLPWCNRNAEFWTYTYYLLITGISLYLYVCLIIYYISPELYGTEVFSLLGCDNLDTGYLDKFTPTREAPLESYNKEVEFNSTCLHMFSSTANYFNLFQLGLSNITIEIEELRNTFYINKNNNLHEYTEEVCTEKNKSILLFIDYFRYVTQRLESSKNNK